MATVGGDCARRRVEESAEARCETCGNDYDKAMRLVIDGHVFDSFECAIEAVALRCANCGRRIISDRRVIFCCAHCAHLKCMEWAPDRV